MDQDKLGQIVHDELCRWRDVCADRLGYEPEDIALEIKDTVTILERRIGLVVAQHVYGEVQHLVEKLEAGETLEHVVQRNALEFSVRPADKDDDPPTIRGIFYALGSWITVYIQSNEAAALLFLGMESIIEIEDVN